MHRGLVQQGLMPPNEDEETPQQQGPTPEQIAQAQKAEADARKSLADAGKAEAQGALAASQANAQQLENTVNQALLSQVVAPPQFEYIPPNALPAPGGFQG